MLAMALAALAADKLRFAIAVKETLIPWLPPMDAAGG